MSITTLDAALAGMVYPREIIKYASGTLVAGRPFTHFYTRGIPGEGTASNAGIDGEVLIGPVSGQIPFENPVSGNSYLARFQAQATQSGSLLLCDKLWANSGLVVTSTSEQMISGAQIPARDANGLDTGDQVYAAVEVTTATGAGTPTLTLKYTNTSGQTNRIAYNAISTSSSSAKGTFYPIGLAAGDKGIQKVESLRLSATWTSGNISLVLYRIIARLELTTPNTPNAIDALTGGFPRIYDNSVLFTVFIPCTTSSTYISGHVIYSQG